MDLTHLLRDISADNENEEDYENFFLQPASSPYNIAEKVKKANEALSMDNPDLDGREVKVKFREDLVDYEPSLTEDDVNSIESEEEAPGGEQLPKLGSVERSVFSDESVQSVINLDAGRLILEDVGEEEEECKEHQANCSDIDYVEGEEEEEEISDDEIAEESVKETETEEEADFSEPEESSELAEGSEQEEIKASTKKKQKRRKFNQNNHRFLHNQEVNCRNHCIENLDLGLRIKKLNIHEKPVVSPILKLQERKCCEDINSKNQNLPVYAGHRSEYGLSLEQLERREKMNQIIRMKAEKRQQILREFRERKRQQNEEVFCEWLRNVSKRKSVTTNKQKTVKETLSPKIINLPPANKPQQQKARPLTAPLPPKSPFFMRQKRRPQTSPAYVYIQVPQTVLRRGISVGNIYVSLSGAKNRNIDIIAES